MMAPMTFPVLEGGDKCAARGRINCGITEVAPMNRHFVHALALDLHLAIIRRFQPGERPVHGVVVGDDGRAGQRHPRAARAEALHGGLHRPHHGHDREVAHDEHLERRDGERRIRQMKEREQRHPQRPGVTLDVLAGIEHGPVAERDVLRVAQGDHRVVANDEVRLPTEHEALIDHRAHADGDGEQREGDGRACDEPPEIRRVPPRALPRARDGGEPRGEEDELELAEVRAQGGLREPAVSVGADEVALAP